MQPPLSQIHISPASLIPPLRLMHRRASPRSTAATPAVALAHGSGRLPSLCRAGPQGLVHGGLARVAAFFPLRHVRTLAEPLQQADVDHEPPSPRAPTPHPHAPSPSSSGRRPPTISFLLQTRRREGKDADRRCRRSPPTRLSSDRPQLPPITPSRRLHTLLNPRN